MTSMNRDRIKTGDKITKLRLRMMEDPRPQYVIAAAACISPARLSQFAMGVRPIPQYRVYALCEVLECNPEDLLGFADLDE